MSSIPRFKKILIANRGEIVRRVIHACREMGIRTVAVYSEADRSAPYLSDADEAYEIGPAPSMQSYLNIEKILQVARQAGVDAIHPGYGFLSENPAFAQACDDAGMVFIGPPAEVIRLLGDKGTAKRLAENVNVPIVPGFNPAEQATDAEKLLKEAKKVGFPVLLKAAAGGGGKGMRIVQSPDEFLPALESVKREATSAFGDDRVMLERYISRPRHIEVQILGDQHGNLVHLFERECSLQRRYQKIVEESPSPALSSALREQITDAAVRLGRAAGYVNAGTVEFLLEEKPDGSGAFYFLEVNTRLQVEHPVTEMVTGLDLVQWQIRIAQGEPFLYQQQAIHQHGYAIEARLYAEDPNNQFLPSIGTLALWQEPTMPGVRIDSFLKTGCEITHHYDPMLAKVIAYAETREMAICSLRTALEQFHVLGVQTNTAFLIRLLNHPDFVAGRLHTGFIEEHRDALLTQANALPIEVLTALAVSEMLGRSQSVSASISLSDGDVYSPWKSGDGWRNVHVGT
jgi:3-methylcrotonyl-CoA carboxylase alpha subunit